MIWLTFIGLGLVTFLLRFSFMGLLGQRPLPAGLARLLPFVPLAVLTAITVPEVLLPAGWGWGWDTATVLPRVLAAGVAISVAWLTGKVGLTLLLGMLALWLVQAAVGG